MSEQEPVELRTQLQRLWRILLRRVGWPFGEIFLVLLYNFLKHVWGPFLRNFVPEPIRDAGRKLILQISEFINQQFLLGPLGNLMGRAMIAAVHAKYEGTPQEEQAKLDVEVFVSLGVDGRFAANYGSGNERTWDNCFFPVSLGKGPTEAFYDETNPNASLINSEIALTTLLISIISYRSDTDIQKCMHHYGMFPGVKFYSVHTKAGETDLSIFCTKEWAVFCFRGTEYETLRDLITSTFVEAPAPFPRSGSEKSVRRQYYDEILFCGDQRVGPACPLPDRKSSTVFETAKAWYEGGKKIYCCGHSLGGGLATLFGAHLQAAIGVTPAAIITFGSPPIAGNGQFLTWYNAQKFASWRFAHGTEFATMAPPLPYTIKVKLYHVGDYIDAKDMKERNASERDPEAVLEDLARRHKLSSILYDHNPVLTLRLLQKLRRDLQN